MMMRTAWSSPQPKLECEDVIKSVLSVSTHPALNDVTLLNDALQQKMKSRKRAVNEVSMVPAIHLPAPYNIDITIMHASLIKSYQMVCNVDIWCHD